LTDGRVLDEDDVDVDVDRAVREAPGQAANDTVKRRERADTGTEVARRDQQLNNVEVLGLSGTQRSRVGRPRLSLSLAQQREAVTLAGKAGGRTRCSAASLFWGAFSSPEGSGNGVDGVLRVAMVVASTSRPQARQATICGEASVRQDQERL